MHTGIGVVGANVARTSLVCLNARAEARHSDRQRSQIENCLVHPYLVPGVTGVRGLWVASPDR